MAIDWVNITDFGAVGDYSKDCTTAIQNAFNSLPSTGGTIYIPTGNFIISSQITISQPCVNIVGDGFSSAIFLKTLTQNGFVFTTGAGIGGISVKDIYISSWNSSPKTGGAALVFNTSNSTINYRTLIDHVLFSFQYNAVDFETAAAFHVVNSHFLESQNCSIIVKNNSNGDDGDSSIINNFFIGSNFTSTAIYQESSGGLRIIGNKVNNGSTAYHLNFNSNVDTSILLVEGNSFENQADYGLYFNRVSGNTHTFRFVNISGNEIAYIKYGIATSTDNFLSDVTVSNNIINVKSGSGNNCITFNAGSNININNNMLSGTNNNSVGVYINNAVTQVRVGINRYTNLTSRINSNTPLDIIIDKTTVTGKVQITANTSYSQIFYGTVNVSLPSGAFSTAPNIALNLQGVTASDGTQIHLLPYSITSTGFSIIGYSNVKDDNITIAYTATGM